MRKFYLIIIALATVLTFLSCRKDPLVNMQTITLSKENVTEEPKSVTIVGTFSYPGTIDSVRVCAADNEYLFNLETYPTVMSGKNFTATLTGLHPATTYYYYYAVYYGAAKPFETEIRNFKTTDFKLPEVITAVVSFVGSDNAICGGEVTDDGGSTVSARGVCYGQQPEPTLEGNHTIDSCGTGAFVSNITGLLKNTKYYVRAYATNEKGTSYGIDMEFTTSALSPTVKTISVTDIDTISARVSCEVVSDGGSELKERGVCWSIHQNPTLEDEHLVVGNGVGLFTANVTGLNPSTKYYIRAYAKNGSGLGFGEVLEFTTANIVTYPTVSTVEIKNVTALTATAVGNVSSDGGAEITSRGFCWSKTANPTIQNAHVEVSGTTGVFESSLTGLEANTTYHVRAYAVNSKGAGYGEELTFTTTEGLPVVVTSSVTEITATSAKCGGNVTDQGASNVTERGICWSTNHNPTIADSHASGGSGTGTYTCSMTGLTPNATYYVRAYAKNTQGISYGTEVNFVALEGLPTVTTSAVTSITSTTATGGGNVTNQGASNVTERGICWGTEHNPAMNGSHASSGSGAGQFTAQMTGLTPGTKYYVRAYAKNTQGVTYGMEVEFTTTATMPTVTTGSVSEITQTTATGGGNVTSDGGSSVTERGICWSTDANPTIEMNHIASGSGTGNFSASMTGLTAGTTYHVRAYATNSAGTAYGNDVTFTTTATLPTVTTAQVSNITQTTAVGGGNVTSDGGATVTERGVCWSLNADPTTSDSHATSGTGTGGFTANMTGLTANTTYHVRAYAKNSQGTSYGSDVTFTTSQSISAPTVTTSAVTTITQTTAVGGGNVTADGGANVTERGICWGTSQNPTTSGTHSNSGTGIGDYTVQMSGLTANTTYYVRAYAVNSAGTSYGNEVSFTTLVDLPVVTTSTVSNITQTTATGGGNVTSGVNVTERGICWSTTQNPTTSGSHIASGTGTGGFTADMTGLTANTTYYVRAYAVNAAGTAYGSQVNFTTLQNIALPTLTTNSITDITQNTATCGGNITNDGGGTITARGVCWSTTQNPTTGNSHTTDGSGTGSFTSSITGLSPNTTYYVRAYAVNAAGTAYGSQISFTTQSSSGGSIGGHEYVDLGLPSGVLWATCNVGASSPEQYGDYYAWGETTTKATYNSSTYQWYNGSELITKYNTKPNYGIVDDKIILDLQDDAAYANWGNDWRMPTDFDLEELNNVCVIELKTQNGVYGKQCTGPNGNSIFLPAAGFYENENNSSIGIYISCWSSSLYVDLPNQAKHLGNTVSHYYRTSGRPIRPVYAPRPIVTTHIISDITTTSAICGGIVIADGGNTVTERGVCWSTSQNPTTSNSHTTDGSGTGSFISSITGLSPNTTYYVRAYAINNAGTSYGLQKVLKTFIGNVPDGAINGLFTTDFSGNQVFFSKGNLQYVGNNNPPYWKFADDQWEYLGNNGQGSESQDVSRDLLGWGTSGYNHGAINYQPWSTSGPYSNYYAYGSYLYNLYDQNGKADWGYNAISNGGNISDQWRTPTREEWNWIFNNRQTTSGIRYAKAQVNGVGGMIIVPDNWVESTYYLNDPNTSDANYTSNIISENDWENTFETHGCVFLPAAGFRSNTTLYDTTYGYYASSTVVDDRDIYGLFFTTGTTSYVFVDCCFSREKGYAVRLVQNY